MSALLVYEWHVKLVLILWENCDENKYMDRNRGYELSNHCQ
jgi:hypothetical protein